MTRILIVDHSPLCRELLAKTLEASGFPVMCAATTGEAAGALSTTMPDLIILDPACDGGAMRWLEALRHHPASRSLPVIILTDLLDRALVVRVGQLSVRDYILKQRFSLAELLIRIQRSAHPADAPTAAGAPATPTAVSEPPCPAPATEPRSVEHKLVPRKRLTHEQTLARVESGVRAKTLPGVVSEIIALVNSPRGAVPDVAQALKHDPVLAARVLHMANSAAFISQKPHVTSIEEAVRNIGIGGVRGMVLSVGIFESFDGDTSGHFEPLRFWQHSFAVAALMEKLVPVSDAAPAGAAHLVGLCHDLPELALCQEFPEEYAAAFDLAERSGTSLSHARSLVFGMPYHELAVALLRKLGLPPTITVPIEETIERAATRCETGHGSLLARALRMANVYVNGLMLPSVPEAWVTPFSLAECRGVFDKAITPAPDIHSLRSEALMLVNTLSGITTREAASWCRPPLEKSPARIWYARHGGYSDFDPLAVFLAMSGEVSVHPQPPAMAELDHCDVVVVAAPRQANPTPAQQQIDQFLKLTAPAPKPLVYLSGAEPDALSPGVLGRCLRLPVRLHELVDAMKWALGASQPVAQKAAA